MQALSVFHNLLANACPEIHATRLNALLAAVKALLDGRELTLTRVGRALSGTATTKSNINRVNRLLNNQHLQQERAELYAVHAALVLGKLQRPVILIDWSDITPQRTQLLRVSASIKGRGIMEYWGQSKIIVYFTLTLTNTRSRGRVLQLICPIVLFDFVEERSAVTQQRSSSKQGP